MAQTLRVGAQIKMISCSYAYNKSGRPIKQKPLKEIEQSFETDVTTQSKLVKLNVKAGDDGLSDFSNDSDIELPRTIVPVQTEQSPVKVRAFSTNLKYNRWTKKEQAKPNCPQYNRSFMNKNNENQTTRKTALYSSLAKIPGSCTINLVSHVKSRSHEAQSLHADTVTRLASLHTLIKAAESRPKPTQLLPNSVKTVRISLPKKVRQ